MMTPLKVLHLCHNHPALHPGGTEIFALDLHRQLNAGGEVDGLFIGCVDQNHRRQRPGTVFQGIGPNSNEMLMWTGHFDGFYLSQIDLHGIVPELTDLLVNLKPDIVHFHHILLMGAEILFLVRRILPKAKIVMSLHDYYSICANDGQMVTTGDRRLCHQASPDACHRCFPQLEPEQFVAWGIAADRIEVLRNARPEQNIVPHRTLKKGGLRGNFAYFGNLSPNKGVLVLLEAARLLHQRHPGAFRLDIHGGAPFQSDAFKADLAAALARV
ncbi:MAG: glycosyl transferase, partial [Rhodospirillaceae bacterium]|nr:glycosyl transferase [Rhodospirillaceae bacterium]